jgi:hypothetical protein
MSRRVAEGRLGVVPADFHVERQETDGGAITIPVIVVRVMPAFGRGQQITHLTLDPADARRLAEDLLAAS